MDIIDFTQNDFESKFGIINIYVKYSTKYNIGDVIKVDKDSYIIDSIQYTMYNIKLICHKFNEIRYD